jgi:hypothetical protein
VITAHRPALWSASLGADVTHPPRPNRYSVALRPPGCADAPGVSTQPYAFAWSHRSGARSCDERAPGVNFGQPLLNISDSAVGRRRTIACFPGVAGSLGDDGSQYAAGAGREMGEREEPGRCSRAAVGQLGNRSCGPVRIITRFLPPAASSSRPSACRSRAPGLAGCGSQEHPLAANGSSTPLWPRTRRRPGALRRPQTRRPPGPDDVPYERSPP